MSKQPSPRWRSRSTMRDKPAARFSYANSRFRCFPFTVGNALIEFWSFYIWKKNCPLSQKQTFPKSSELCPHFNFAINRTLIPCCLYRISTNINAERVLQISEQCLPRRGRHNLQESALLDNPTVLRLRKASLQCHPHRNVQR